MRYYPHYVKNMDYTLMLALEYLSFRTSVSLPKRSVVTKYFAKNEFNTFLLAQ